MNIVTSILTNNRCYNEDGNIKVKGLMLHSVGCTQPNAEAFVKSWNNYNTAVCVHAFIDANTGDVWQTLPWNHRAWHCGGRANDTHIGVEMCESNYITYTSGTTFSISDKKKAKAHAKKAYESAVELFAFLCKQYGLNPFADGVIISHCEGNQRGVASNHGDPEHYWNGLGMGYTMDGFRRDVAIAMGLVQAVNPVFDINTATGQNMVGQSNADVISTIALLAREDYKTSKILPSITIAQAILESAYLHSELCVNANNIFGMKCYLSGNNWGGTAWDGVSVYSKVTNEEDADSNVIQVYADFRAYPSLKMSVKDHSAYLVNAKSGKNYRYKGISGETNFRLAAMILKKGGYATDSRYVDRLVSLYNTWNLGQYDVFDKESADTAQLELKEVVSEDGKAEPFLVRVSIDDLRIRSGPGTQYDFRRYIPIGVYTIVETQGVWGRLKSGEGWICLDYTEKVEQ